MSQNTVAEFFDPAWMFKDSSGELRYNVMGNPPCRIQLQIMVVRLIAITLLNHADYKTFAKRGGKHIVALHYERGWRLLKEQRSSSCV